MAKSKILDDGLIKVSENAPVAFLVEKFSSTIPCGVVSNMSKCLKLRLNEMLKNKLHFEQRKLEFSILYKSVVNQVHSGPGYWRQKCSEMKKIYSIFDNELHNMNPNIN